MNEEAAPGAATPSRPRRIPSLIIVAALLVAGGLLFSMDGLRRGRSATSPNAELAAQNHEAAFRPTEAQWADLKVAPVEKRVFRSEHVTEGKVAVDDDRATPIFSPYAGRVIKLLVQPGDEVKSGQPLFTIEAADMVQAQNDFIAAVTAVNKARAQLSLAEITDKRLTNLLRDKAVALREVEQGHAALVAAQNDMRAADTALEAVRNRLRILGKTDAEIATFEQTGKISPETPINAPIGGTIVQRKVGPGQYVGNGSSDPVFVIGDLSTVWLVAYVRETEAPKMRIGEPVSFSLLAYPGQTFRGNIKYIATTLDPTTRRLLVRATIPNHDGALKPEMYASVSIFTDEGDMAPAVPRDAVIYEGNTARVWIARADKGVELRQIMPGVVDDGWVQVLEGLAPGETVITKGSLFIDRAAANT